MAVTIRQAELLGLSTDTQRLEKLPVAGVANLCVEQQPLSEEKKLYAGRASQVWKKINSKKLLKLQSGRNENCAPVAPVRYGGEETKNC
jgi:hypothetical protein